MSSPYDFPLQFPFAANLFGLRNGLGGYLIPKPKFLFYVQFVIRAQYQLPNNEFHRIGYLVKNVDRPKLQYKSQELDQYNRKRVAYTKIDYPSVSLTLHDTVDGAASKMIDDYNRFHFGDFSNMFPGDNSDTHNSLWTNNSIIGNDMTYWGYRLKNPMNYANAGPINRGLPGAEYFFDEINIYELYGQNFTMYSLMNPKIESVNFSSTDTSSADGQEISLTVNPEGVLFRYIDAPLNYSTLASMILPGPGFTTNNFPISELDLFLNSLVGSVAAVGGGLLNNLTDGLYGAFGTSLIGNLGYLGPLAPVAQLSSSPLAQAFTSPAALGASGGNVLEPISSISSNGAGVSLAQSGFASLSTDSITSSINSLY